MIPFLINSFEEWTDPQVTEGLLLCDYLLFYLCEHMCVCAKVYLCQQQPQGLFCFLAELLHPPPLHSLHHLEQVRLPQHWCPAVLQQLRRTQAQMQKHMYTYACTILHRCTLLCSKKNKRCSKTINLIIILNLGDISVNKCTGEAAKRQPPIGGGGHRLLLSLSLLTDFYFVPLLLKLRVFHK